MAKKMPILTFHDIDDRPEVINLSPAVFESGLAMLHREGYRTIGLDTMTSLLRGQKPFPERCFSITFDDGYRSVYERAFPILERYGMTATVFLLAGEKASASSKGGTSPTFGGRPMLSWKEIREMRSYGIDFGAHTRTHPDLTGLPLEHARDEIHYSKTAIEDALGYSVASFAYPFGRYNRQIINMVKELFSCAFTDKLGLVNRKSNQYEIERVDAYYLRTNRSFNLILTRLFPWYIKARNIPRVLRRSFKWDLYQ